MALKPSLVGGSAGEQKCTRDPADLYLELLKKALIGALYDEGQWTIENGGTPLRRFIIQALRKWSIVLVEIAPDLTGHGLPLFKCEAYNRVYEQPYGSR